MTSHFLEVLTVAVLTRACDSLVMSYTYHTREVLENWEVYCSWH